MSAVRPEVEEKQQFEEYKRKIGIKNRIAFILDGAGFNTGGAFLEANTVLPTYVSTLTNSPLLIGLVSTTRNFGYLIPQIFVARYMEKLPNKKPLMIKAGWVMRTAAFGLAFSALFSRNTPGLALAVFYACLVVYALADGFGGLPWTDIVAKTIPPEKRASLFGTMQAVGGIGAFLSGFLVRTLLEQQERYPMNYFAVMFIGAIFMLASLLVMHFITDLDGETSYERASVIEYLKRLPSTIMGNVAFRRVLVVRMLVGGLYLVLPFFAIHAQSALNFPKSIVGLFISAQMVGSVVGGPLWGYLGDNRGAYWVVRLVALLTGATGVLALCARLLFSLGWIFLTYAVYFLLYFCLGASLGGVWIGFSNYVIDVADNLQRATFLGVLNTVTAPLTLLSVVGGWILQTSGYVALFALMVGVLCVACMLAWKLPDSRNLRPE
ncbi:MAG: MFS transporter [Bacillota bacterium]